ncbi:MAG: RecX family transcriptional regulator [Dysgonamonadaceae bacterium]|jgi:regulatory protein|nr:RecX family transcriptional regulator [Dysgonamonadaceae bacterium]
MSIKSSGEALHLLAAYCSRAERCISDVKKKLIQWEVSDTDQNDILKRLQEEKFLEETRFCRAFVNDKSKYNKWGVYKIRFELKKKHIPENIIREALGNIIPDENDERLLQLLQTKQKSVKGNDEFEIRQKLMRFAAGRGFSPEEIEKVMENFS